MTETVIIQKYIGLALAPIHVGSKSKMITGIDSSVARDVDGLPYIPATTLKGCARAYSFLDYGLLDCDGKGQQCSQPHVCASCAVYGYLSYLSGQGSTSLVRFTDAHLLFIPVQTQIGMIWLASSKRLVQSDIIPSQKERDALTCVRFPDTIVIADSLTRVISDQEINIGSLKVTSHSAISIHTGGWLGPEDVRPAYERCVVVPEEHFGALANDALTVLTSVAINGATGSVKPGALFSIEAVPRSSVFIFEVGYIDPDKQGIEQFVNERGSAPSRLAGDFTSLTKIVEAGLEKCKILGVGGKRSRGFGLLKVWPIPSDLTRQSKPGKQGGRRDIDSVSVPRPSAFIGYSHKDKMIVRRLAADLQKRQIIVWLDEREILVGDSIHRRIAEGVTHTDFLILVLSQASIQSGWVEREVNAGLMRELQRKHVVVLPILVDQLPEERIPVLLRDRRYANFFEDYDEGLHKLVISIKEHQRRRKMAIN